MTAAVRAAAHFDRRLVSPRGGALAAIPVLAVLGVPTALGQPVAGVTMGAGAMLVGIAWRITGGRPPLVALAADACLLSLSTFVGCVTGSVDWLHLLVLCLWSLGAGLLVGVGNRGGIVGTQSIIALVVFGRFSEPAPAALGLAAYVLAGGAAQVAFLTIVRWPGPLRGQRAATATAYRALAGLAAGSPGASALPAAAALDEAQTSLTAPTLFGDQAIMTLRSLVNEGHRLRISMTAIHALVRRLQALAEDDAEAQAGAASQLALTGAALELAARVIEAEEGAESLLSARVTDLEQDGRRTELLAETPAEPLAQSTAIALSRRLASLRGQVRAVAALAPAAGSDGGLRGRRPVRHHAVVGQRARELAAQLRANVSLESPAGRHAIRLAVVVPGAALIARGLPLQRGYWMVVAAATVLRPEFGATFTRGAERAVGTCLGVGLAGAIAATLHPTGAATVLIVGLAAWAGYATLAASFAVGYAFITALVVFLINVVSPDTFATAAARLLDTLVGGAIGLTAYALWPTWSETSALKALADLVAAERAYLNEILAALADGRRALEAAVRPLARRARLARTGAVATVGQSLSEPETRRIDADQSEGSLGATRRLIQSAHILRLDAEEDRPRVALPAITPLRADLDELLGLVESAMRTPVDGDGAGATQAQMPDLRARYEQVEREHPSDPEALAMLAELDEIVDAADSLAALWGLEES